MHYQCNSVSQAWSDAMVSQQGLVFNSLKLLVMQTENGVSSLTCSAVSRWLLYLMSDDTRSIKSVFTSGRISSQGRAGNTVQSSKGATLNCFASGHVSGVGVPMVLKTLKIRPSWLPSSWTARDSKIGIGGSRSASASITPKPHMSTSGPYDLFPKRTSIAR